MEKLSIMYLNFVEDAMIEKEGGIKLFRAQEFEAVEDYCVTVTENEFFPMKFHTNI